MLASKQAKLIAERAIEAYIRGLRTDDRDYRLPSKVPSVAELEVEIDGRLASVELGMPFFKGIHQGDVTSARRFNTNLYNLVDDFYIVTDEIIGQIYALSRHFSATEMEFRKADARLKQLLADVNALILISANDAGYMYTTGDIFHDTSKVDLARTSLVVHSKGGYVELSESSVSKINLDHYAHSVLPERLLVDGKVQNADIMGTKFGACIDDSEDSYFMVVVRKGESSTTTLQFSIKLQENNNSISVNEVSISGNGTYSASMRYMNSYTSDWESIGGGKRVVGSNTKYRIAPYMLVNLSEDHGETDPGISNIEFTLTKDSPDRFTGKEYEYEFIVKSIDAYRTSDTRRGDLISTTLPFSDWEGNPFTINQISLSTEESVPPNTFIDYYVGVDPYASGTLLDADGNPVKVGASGVASFEYTDGYPGASGVLYSDLRRYDIDGWSDWEPQWHPITSVERDEVVANSSGNLPPKIVNLGNYAIVDRAADGWMASEMDTVNGIYFWNIYTFPTMPRSVELRQGRRAWLASTEALGKEIMVEVDGVLIEDGDDYYLYIGPTQVPSDGHVRTRGNVVPGSVESVTWYQGDIDNPDESFTTEDRTRDLVADVHVTYDDGGAVVKKNPASVWEVPDYHVKVKFRRLEDATIFKYETYAYVPNNATPYVSFTNTDRIDRIVVANMSETGRTLIHDGGDLSRILLPQGWNHITIYLSPGATWNPSTNVSIPNRIEYYAYLEPLNVVGKRAMLYNTHRDDHRKCTIYASGGVYYMAVNDPCTPSGLVSTYGLVSSGILYYHETLGQPLNSGNIFSSPASVDAFYDLSYRAIFEEVTNVMLKVEFGGDGTISPSLHSYEFRGGDELELKE